MNDAGLARALRARSQAQRGYRNFMGPLFYAVNPLHRPGVRIAVQPGDGGSLSPRRIALVKTGGRRLR